MGRYALIDNDGFVVNVIELDDPDATIAVPILLDDGTPLREDVDGVSVPVMGLMPAYTPSDGLQLIADPDSASIIGGTYNGSFQAPEPTPVEAPNDPALELAAVLHERGLLDDAELARVTGRSPSEPTDAAPPAEPTASTSRRP